MLFLFDEPTRQAFWNQGLLIALDLAFLDAGGFVLETCTLRSLYESAGHIEQCAPKRPYRMAVEMPRGSLHAAPGMRLYAAHGKLCHGLTTLSETPRPRCFIQAIWAT
jgi:uncharacterized membrane protein (UPF0127 family)